MSTDETPADKVRYALEEWVVFEFQNNLGHSGELRADHFGDGSLTFPDVEVDA